MNARLIFVLITCLFAVAGCPGRQGGGRPQERLAVLGAILPLTGAASYLGEQELIGLQSGVETYNRQRGTAPRLELHVEDTGGQAGRAATAAHKLLEIDHAQILFVTMSSAFRAVAPIAETSHTPMLVMASEPDIVRDHPQSFRIYMNFTEEAQSLARHVTNARAQRLAIVRLKIDAFAGEVRELRSRLPPGTQVVAEETYDPPVREFRELLANVATQRPDMVLVLPLGGEFPTLMEQMRANQGLAGVPVLAGYAVTTAPAQERGADLFRNVTFTTFPVGRDTPEVARAFAGRRTRGGRPLTDFMDYAYAYDSVLFAGRGLSAWDGRGPLGDALARVTVFAGITGNHTLTAREISAPMRLARYENGRLTHLP